MYRISLSDGSAEKIGEGIKGSGRITFYRDTFMTAGRFMMGQPAVLGGDWKPLEGKSAMREIAISYDARVVISDGIFLTDCHWVMPEEEPLPEFLVIDNGYEDVKKKLESEGIKVFEPGELEELRSKKKKGFFAKLFGKK